MRFSSKHKAAAIASWNYKGTLPVQDVVITGNERGEALQSRSGSGWEGCRALFTESQVELVLSAEQCIAGKLCRKEEDGTWTLTVNRFGFDGQQGVPFVEKTAVESQATEPAVEEVPA
jgi:hypothetical protein